MRCWSLRFPTLLSSANQTGLSTGFPMHCLCPPSSLWKKSVVRSEAVRRGRHRSVGLQSRLAAFEFFRKICTFSQRIADTNQGFVGLSDVAVLRYFSAGSPGIKIRECYESNSTILSNRSLQCFSVVS